MSVAFYAQRPAMKQQEQHAPKPFVFVLQERPVLTDEMILDDIKQVASKLNSDYVSISLYKEHGRYSQCAIRGHFGTWKDALHLAGLRTERTSTELKLIPDENIYKDLRRVAKLIDTNTITISEYETYGKYSFATILKRFTSWDNALVNAGLQGTGLAKIRVSEQEVLEEIERIWVLLGRQPTHTDIVKRGISKYSIDTFKRRFGSWRKALEAFIVWVNGERSTNQSSEMVNHDTSEIINKAVGEQSESASAAEKRCHKTSRNINLRLRFKVLLRDNFTCQACGASPAKNPNVELHVDHITPWSTGGETVFDNLQTLCSKCNLGKSDLT